MDGIAAQSDLIVIAGDGGFIGGALVRYFRERGCRRIRAVDKKPLAEWYQRVPDVECVRLDLSLEANCRRAVDGAAEVNNLAADMGGMGFIEQFRIDCLRNILIDTHLIEAASAAGVGRYFFASSACVYNTNLQSDPNVTALKEGDAYPAMAERGYGWEKLVSEMFCQEYWAERGRGDQAQPQLRPGPRPWLPGSRTPAAPTERSGRHPPSAGAAAGRATTWSPAGAGTGRTRGCFAGCRRRWPTG